MAGACVGFLLHNRYKASVFMGDTGSLALGGALAAMAGCTGMFFPLFISSGIFVLETLSVVMQVSTDYNFNMFSFSLLLIVESFFHLLYICQSCLYPFLWLYLLSHILSALCSMQYAPALFCEASQIYLCLFATIHIFYSLCPKLIVELTFFCGQKSN